MTDVLSRDNRFVIFRFCHNRLCGENDITIKSLIIGGWTPLTSSLSPENCGLAHHFSGQRKVF